MRRSLCLRDQMKLFIWEGAGVLSDYTDGMIFAIADDLESARRIIDESACEGEYPATPTEIVDLSNLSYLEPKAWYCWGGG